MILNSFVLEANLVRLYLPEPPTPTNKAFPPGYLIIREIISKCSKAKLNKTKSIFLAVNSL